jgi:hypothetical protein
MLGYGRTAGKTVADFYRCAHSTNSNLLCELHTRSPLAYTDPVVAQFMAALPFIVQAHSRLCSCWSWESAAG